MSNAKTIMTAIIEHQPDDSTYDEILRELAYARTIDRGLQDADNGRVTSDEEIKRSIESWQK